MSEDKDILQIPYLIEQLWVSLEPRTRIEKWSVHEFTFSTNSKISRHLIGEVGGKKTRITSEIKHFDPLKKKVVTRSGRIYTLQGNSALSEATMATLLFWKDKYRVVKSTDVSEEYQQAIRNIMH